MFFKFWTIQALWVFITLLPTLIMNSERRAVPVGVRDYVGWTMWGLGFLVEVVADMQKSIFKADPRNEVGNFMYTKHTDESNSGKIHNKWAMELFKTSKLFWRDISLVWNLYLLFECLQGLPVSLRPQSSRCHASHHKTVR